MKITRRTFVKSAGALAGGMVASMSTGCTGILPTDRYKRNIRIDHISFGYDEHIFRAPVGFAGAVVNRATMVTVRCSVRTAAGKPAWGFGSMPFNHTFSFPSRRWPFTKSEGRRSPPCSKRPHSPPSGPGATSK